MVQILLIIIQDEEEVVVEIVADTLVEAGPIVTVIIIEASLCVIAGLVAGVYMMVIIADPEKRVTKSMLMLGTVWEVALMGYHQDLNDWQGRRII